jgi:cytochrome c551/c552
MRYANAMRFVVLWAVLALASQGQELENEATAILQKKCLGCHNPTAKVAGLNLNTRAAAASSFGRILEKVQSGQMPPGNPLPPAERDTIARWIAAGSPWSGELKPNETKRAGRDHWSLQPLANETKPIDHYLAAARAAKGLQANPPADKRTLIRRATFDLTGLPPTPDEIQAFERDTAADAYANLLDRLLASPAYGERWGRHWMDVIRFGESHGYEQNHLRPNAWPFRDYLIRSFNDDKPFNRLILEHLAGDVIAPDDPQIAIGSAFLVAGPHDTVGNQNEAARRQQRADDLDDMINATSSAFLGLTVSCARCHDHKFDPIQQRDYYRMAAVFNGFQHGDRNVATAAEQAADRARRDPLETGLKAATASLEAIRKEAEPAVAAQREAILAKYRPPVDTRLTEERFPAVTSRYIRLNVRRTANGGAAGLEELEVWSGERNLAPGAKLTASSTRKADDNAEAYAASLLNDGLFDRRWFAAAGGPVTLTVELPRAASIDRLSWSRDRAGGFQGKFEGSPISDYVIEVSNDGSHWQPVASSDGRLPFLPAEREELLLLTVVDARTKAEYQKLEARRKNLQQQLNALPKFPTVYAGKSVQPAEPIYLLKGGNVMNRGDAVAPASLSTAPFASFEVGEQAPEGQRRLALAKWLADARNPLTPRVIANRLWHYHFGTGLVATPSDFGYNGERPTHPELLDALANQLIAGGWRLKPLHKAIMMSEAYRQSSQQNETNARIDADARYLWRFPPQRLSAEAIRDAILAVSGKLDRRAGGPGFHLFRYTVDNVATYFPITEFPADTFRRAVYQTAARSVRSELLGQYDCPDSSLPEPKRIVTISPLQALALLNNAFVLDQARYFAERLQKEPDPIGRAFALAFGRPPTAAENASAQALIRQHGLKAFARAILNANEFVYVM